MVYNGYNSWSEMIESNLMNLPKNSTMLTDAIPDGIIWISTADTQLEFKCYGRLLVFRNIRLFFAYVYGPYAKISGESGVGLYASMKVNDNCLPFTFIGSVELKSNYIE